MSILVPPGAAGRCASVRRALTRAGVEVATGPECQVLVVDGPDGWATDRIRAGSADGQRIIVVVSAAERPSAAAVWSLLALGASAVVAWTDDSTTAAVLARLDRWRQIDRLLEAAPVRRQVVGRSTALLTALRELTELAAFGSAPVLITGETGTGKELAARIVHELGHHRAAAELVVVDCTTIVPTLSGSELFGHERGAFTGAVAARSGALAAANGGTLFLDEIGELPLPLQAELLRAVQEGVYKRVGGDVWHRSSFRLVAATNRDLRAEQAAGRFRADLYHRLASTVVRMPPLRVRTDDVAPLFRSFLAQSLGVDQAPPLDDAVLAVLRSRDWPGNVRELRHLAARVASRHVGPGPVTPGDLPVDDRPARSVAAPETPPGPDEAVPDRLAEAVAGLLAEGCTLKEAQRRVGDTAVELAVREASGNLQAAAARLGVTDRALQLRRAKAQSAG